MADRLDREAWLKAGLALLADQGVDAVRITDLAARLEVTKGSFYWHFRDRSAFLNAMLETWESVATDAIIATIDASGGDARAKLRMLFQKSLDSDGRLFLAIQGWARSDSRASAALNKITRRRIAYVKQLFLEAGFAPRDASVRAEFAFQALIGHYALGPASMFAGQGKSGNIEIVFNMLLRDAD
ncbi:TetR/AcrR family transcriptional regulator [Bradyrhizobium sp. HKCCYLS20291]|uniref:TetR/AcrR family transcriptional regulator n=1 Tax=Bradyrhizobium sp. HKCCYLS20291 TaxID=3420766 RepID=UPI003EB86625